MSGSISTTLMLSLLVNEVEEDEEEETDVSFAVDEEGRLSSLGTMEGKSMRPKS